MIAFAGMIAPAAEKVGIKVPPDPDGDYDVDAYPHFHVFCVAQLGRPIQSPGEHWENAKIVAKIPEKKIRSINWAQLRKLGFKGIDRVR